MYLRQLLDNVEARGDLSHVPVSVTLEFTYRCNFACTHCYLAEPDSDKWPREITGADFCRIIDQLCDLGTFSIACQGGEIFIHPDWQEILSYARKRGLFLHIKTNASLINAAALAFLEKQMPMILIDLSLYGLDENTYEAVTKNQGSYKKFSSSLTLVQRSSIPYRLNMLLTKKNLFQAKAARDYAQRLGVEIYFDPLVIRQVDGGKRSLQERLSPQEIIDFERKNSGLHVFQTGCHKTKEYDCPLGKSSFVITPYGKMNYCIDMGAPQLDVLSTPLAIRWKELQSHAKKIKAAMNQGCGQCGLFTNCTACAADIWHEQGSFTGCAPYYREWASLRTT